MLRPAHRILDNHAEQRVQDWRAFQARPHFPCRSNFPIRTYWISHKHISFSIYISNTDWSVNIYPCLDIRIDVLQHTLCWKTVDSWISQWRAMEEGLRACVYVPKLRRRSTNTVEWCERTGFFFLRQSKILEGFYLHIYILTWLRYNNVRCS